MNEKESSRLAHLNPCAAELSHNPGDPAVAREQASAARRMQMAIVQRAIADVLNFDGASLSAVDWLITPNQHRETVFNRAGMPAYRPAAFLGFIRALARLVECGTLPRYSLKNDRHIASDPRPSQIRAAGAILERTPKTRAEHDYSMTEIMVILDSMKDIAHNGTPSAWRSRRPRTTSEEHQTLTTDFSAWLKPPKRIREHNQELQNENAELRKRIAELEHLANPITNVEGIR